MIERIPLLEVIVSSIADAIAAARGGAGRLEVVSNLEVGGLSPDLSTVEGIVASVPTPVRVMLRQSTGFRAEEGEARKRLLDLTRRFAQLPIEGFVLGFLRDGEVDERALAELVECAPHLRVTFHRALEEVNSVAQAMAVLKRHTEVDRILHSGGNGDHGERAEALASLEALAKPEIHIIAGGGLDERTIKALSARGCVSEFHVGRLARTPPVTGGAVDEERVRTLIRMIEASSTPES